MGSRETFLPVHSSLMHSVPEAQLITDRPLKALSLNDGTALHWRSTASFSVASAGEELEVEGDARIPSSGLTLYPDLMADTVAAALQTTAELLTAFAESETFFQSIHLTFGDSVLVDRVQALRWQWELGEFSTIPLIQIASAAELNGALSAFSQETNTIYLSQAFLDQYATDPLAITNIVLEEFGHFVDTQINLSDAAGDEGAIFAALLQGVYLSEARLQALKTEDDRAFIHLDGQVLQIEQATATTGDGLRGDYFDNANLTNLKLTRIDSTVNFNWGTGSPGTAIAPDTFSVRWTGQVQPTTSGTYRFFTRSDDGIRLWVNGQRIINNWTNHSVTEKSGTIALVGGQNYDIRLEYYENTGSSVAQLLWSGPGVTKQIIPQSRLFSTSIDTTLPTASAAVTNLTTEGSTTYDFTVTYTDNVAVNVSSLDSNDVRVTGPNGFNQLASLVGVNTTGNGTPRTATYRLTGPGGSWDAADNGTYTLALEANQVSDTSNNFAAASTLGTFLMASDTIAPTATATAENVTATGGTLYQFSVTYSDNTAVNMMTLDSSDILVTGPGGFSQQAALVSVNNNANGTPRTATYQITAPGGTWDITDNGTYTFTVQPNQVSDTRGNFMPSSTLGSFLVSLTPGTQENIVFPADAGVLNVKNFGAKGDGITDDTAAIQAALNAYPNGQRIIYLPNGTYLISNTLSWPGGTPGSGNEYKNTILQGQSEQGAIVKLKNGAAGFTNAATPKAMLFTGPAPAQRFGNSIRNLTVDAGVSNPGAIGVQFNASNQGSMRQVTIRSGDGQGVHGLDMNFTDEIGPLLIKNVTVNGFQYGIRTGFTVNSQTLENITLNNQSVYGFYNTGQVINIRKLTSNNAVTAIYNAGGRMTVIDSTLNGTGNAAGQPAIKSDFPLDLVIRNITTSGYQSAVVNAGTTLTGPSISEFISGSIVSQFPTPSKTLNLPIKETPDVPWDDPVTTPWANVVSYGAIPNDGKDDTAAIQAAIDSGKTTVYLPVGAYTLQGTVLLRNNVRRIIGTEANVEVPNTVSPGFKVVDGASPTVVFERIGSGYFSTPTIDNASSRTLVLRDATNVSGHMTGTGDIFIENVVSNPFQNWVFNGQNVWARQFNVENEGTHITNNGGNLWILGLKTERGGTLIDTRAGGKTELLGGFAYTTTSGSDGEQESPMFINNESSISITLGEINYGGGAPYSTYVRETRGGVTRDLSANSLEFYMGGGKHIPLYVGY